VDKIEHAGSMSHDHSLASDGPIHHHEEVELTWSDYFRESRADFCSEFFGTCVLILFGDGVVAQVSLSEMKKGDYQSISWGWG
jgi:aquaglyceroporin related protein